MTHIADDSDGAVTWYLAQPTLELPGIDMQSALNMPFFPLVVIPYIEYQDVFAAIKPLFDFNFFSLS
jgi:hypothetical protein